MNHDQIPIENKERANQLVRMIGNTPLGGEALEGFDEWDKGHIESIARRHGIMLFNKLQAQLFTMAAVKDASSALSLLGSSFSTRSGDDAGDVRLTHIDHNNYDNAEEGYFIALHELGHQVLNHSQNDTSEVMIENEIEAWEWAIAHANRFPSDDTVCLMLDSLATYTDPQHTFTHENRKAVEAWLAENLELQIQEVQEKREEEKLKREQTL